MLYTFECSIKVLSVILNSTVHTAAGFCQGIPEWWPHRLIMIYAGWYSGILLQVF